ncbi:MAG: RNA polymerase sigma factor [Caulobacter sp.]|nr:RNA polymerase sigma factor [Caulobacter sp.]
MSRLKRPTSGSTETDDRSLEGLYRRHAPWLRALLRRRFGATMAEDLTQEAYLRLAQVDTAAIIHPRAVLARTAVHIGYDQARYHARRSGITTVLAHRDAAEVDIPVAAVQGEALRLKEIVLALPPLYRDVFLLSRFEGLTYEAIAVRLGVSMVTVERRMARALALCAAQLRD